MPDSKITALTSIGTSTDPANDPLVLVDVSDTSMAASGTTKKVTLNQLLGAGGTATLASATITGDLTVDTSTLKVDSTNNRVGIGTASPAALLHILAPGSDTAAIRLAATGGRVFDIGSTGAGYGSANNLIIYDITGSAERYRIDSAGICTWQNVGGVGGTAMTLNSTGLGVGGSPATKIFASVTPPGAGQDGIRVTDGTRLIQMSISGSSYSYLGIGANQNVIYASGNPLSILSDAQTLRLGTGTNGYILLDTSGNVGVGVTPSAWASVALQVGPYAGLHQNNSLGSAELTYNCYRSSGSTWNYIQTDTAARYRMWNSTHSWFIAPSGTAGNAITFTQAMVLDASGRLLVGKISGVNNIETVGAGVDGRGSVTGVSTVATTIYTIKQSSTAAMCVVFGDDGSNGFCDIVLFLATVAPKVVSSQTLYGSPAARTYTASTTNLQLAIASGTLTIRTAALSTLNS
jgi:hypothetical protein